MATNHTENYNLNLWEPTDKFVREEFNENTTKLEAALVNHDAALTTKADQTALTALTQTVNTKANQTALNSLTQTVAGKAQVAVGTYTGDQAETRFISTGFTPKAVFVITSDGRIGEPSWNHLVGGLAVTGSPLKYNMSSTSYNAVEIVANGFKIMYKDFGSNYTISINSGVHYYFAIG